MQYIEILNHKLWKEAWDQSLQSCKNVFSVVSHLHVIFFSCTHAIWKSLGYIKPEGQPTPQLWQH